MLRTYSTYADAKSGAKHLSALLYSTALLLREVSTVFRKRQKYYVSLAKNSSQDLYVNLFPKNLDHK